MTVRELMAKLAKMDPDAVVEYPDSYTQNEGWGDGHEDATCVVESVIADGRRVILSED